MTLKELRTKLGLTQTAAAGLLRVGMTTWNRWENDHHVPQGHAAERLRLLESAALDMPCDLSPNFAFNRETISLLHVRNCARCRVAFFAWADKIMDSIPGGTR